MLLWTYQREEDTQRGRSISTSADRDSRLWFICYLHVFYLNFTLLVQIGFIDISFSCACYIFVVICRIINVLNSLKTENFGRAISLELMEGAISLKGGEIPREIPSEFAPGGEIPEGEIPVTPARQKDKCKRAVPCRAEESGTVPSRRGFRS